jgi:uncharacterized protein
MALRSKNRSDLWRHGIAFEDAVRIFEGPTVESMTTVSITGKFGVYAIGLVHGMEVTLIYTDWENDERRTAPYATALYS